jgi:signal transduction histidine kinase
MAKPDLREVAPPPLERELAPDQDAGIKEANRWVSDSMAVLGEAYLEYEEAKLRYELAEKKLRSCSATARQSEKQRAQVVSTIVKMLDLGPGEWVYDESGKMVRKDT